MQKELEELQPQLVETAKENSKMMIVSICSLLPKAFFLKVADSSYILMLRLMAIIGVKDVLSNQKTSRYSPLITLNNIFR